MLGRLFWLLLVSACVVCYECRTTEDDILSQFISPPTESLGKLIPAVTRLLISQLRCPEADSVCLECFDKNVLLKSINASENEIPGQLGRLSVSIVRRLAYFQDSCQSRDGCSDYEECHAKLISKIKKPESLNALEDLLRKIKNLYSPTVDKPCFSGEQLLQALNTSESLEGIYHEKLATSLLYHLLQGACIEVEDAVTVFLDDIFGRYGQNNSINISGLTKLFSDLKIHNEPDHDHDHDHNHHHGNRTHTHHHSSSHHHQQLTPTEPTTHHHHHHDDHIDHDHHHHDDHMDHDHHKESHHGHHHHHTDHEPMTPKHRNDHYNHSDLGDHSEEHVNLMEHSLLNGTSDDEMIDTNLTRSKRSAYHDTSLHTVNKCLGVEGLISKFGFGETLDHRDFIEICPALVQQAVSGACTQHDHTKTKSSPTKLELYGYSSLAVFIISLTSIMVVVILPLMGKRVYQYLLMGMIGLSFGTMSGDALLHLIPQALGLHSHDGGDDHDHSHDEPLTLESIPTYFWRQLAMMGAIYAVFLFETIIELFLGKGADSGDHGHGHSHIPDNIPSQMDRKKQPKAESVMELTSYKSSTTTLSEVESPEKPVDEPDIIFKSPIVCCGLRSMALMITLADTIHNIGDGLAIGASFSSGLQDGLSTSIAVFCHELPHEFGDFVVLLSTGLTFRKALLINFFSALSCFVGLYAGIYLGTADAKNSHWVLTITAGIFLYVALAEMLPELKRSKAGFNSFAMFAIKNFGVLLGIGLMVVIALYEDRIGIAL